MWLSKDERKLLAFYAKKAGQPFGNAQISDDELIRLMKFPSIQHLHNVKKALKDKGLIDFTYLEKHVHFLNVIGQQVPKNIDPNVTMTKESFYLGMKCNSPFSPFNIWFQDNYKWFLPFIISVISIIVTIIIAVCRE